MQGGKSSKTIWMSVDLLCQVVIRLSGHTYCLLCVVLSLNGRKSQRGEREHLHIYPTGVHRRQAPFTHIEQPGFNRFHPFSHHRICQQFLKLCGDACPCSFALKITHVLCVLWRNEVLLQCNLFHMNLFLVLEETLIFPRTLSATPFSVFVSGRLSIIPATTKSTRYSRASASRLAEARSSSGKSRWYRGR